MSYFYIETNLCHGLGLGLVNRKSSILYLLWIA